MHTIHPNTTNPEILEKLAGVKPGTAVLYQQLEADFCTGCQQFTADNQVSDPIGISAVITERRAGFEYNLRWKMSLDLATYFRFITDGWGRLDPKTYRVNQNLPVYVIPRTYPNVIHRLITTHEIDLRGVGEGDLDGLKLVHVKDLDF